MVLYIRVERPIRSECPFPLFLSVPQALVQQPQSTQSLLANVSAVNVRPAAGKGKKNAQDKDKFVPSAIVGFSLCAMIALIFGVVGAVGYGPDVKSVAIAMLKGGAVAVTVKLLLCANVLATFPLIVRSSFTTVENALRGMSVSSSNVMRTAYVFLAAFCGASIPSFGKLVGLVGGVACTFLSLTLPVFMLYNMSRKSTEHALSWGEKVVMAFILLISFAIMVSVTIA